MIRLGFDRGTIVIRGDVGTPFGEWDSAINAYRSLAMHYSDIVEYLTRLKLEIEDKVPEPLPVPKLSSSIQLRDYQQDALEAWLEAGRRGVVELPTGAGKTHVALKAIERLGVSTLVVVPTLDLVDQWRRVLNETFGINIGMVGGGKFELYGITVSTYDSAYIRAEQIGNRFMFLVFDEVHHLPAPNYQQIAEMYIAPYRMGLTATHRRDDEGHLDFPRLVGGVVYSRSADSMTGVHLAPYVHDRIYVDLTPEEREEYEREYGKFKAFVRSRRIRMSSAQDFQRFIMRTGYDSAARKALLARNRAVDIALNSESKLKITAELLRTHSEEKVIIFTRHNRLVYEISRRFLVPAITHETPKDERRAILERFRKGDYRVLVTSQVLDEGIDVPDASVAILLSGSGSSREYIQRLGRILRKQKGKTAKIFEIVTRGTVELWTSRRRHR